MAKTEHTYGEAETDLQKRNILGSILQKTGSERDFFLFLIVGAFAGIAGGINSSVFNNFLSDVYHLSADARGAVEIPRELPGVLIVVVLGLLSFMGDIRAAIVGMVLAAAGMLGLGMFSPTYGVMMIWMMMFSLGTHIFMPLTAGIGMGLSKKEELGMRLGQINAVKLAVTILGYAIVWVGFRYLNFSYRTAFTLGTVMFIIAAVFLCMMRPNKPKSSKARFVFRKRYTLFYVMNFVNGARKQVFLTFAPWVLIQVYHIGPPVFAILGTTISLLGIFTRTIVGKAIDVLGEKFVLTAEAAILIVLCVGYAFAGDFFSAGIAMVIVASCYVLDESITAVSMARSTYMKKISVDEKDVTPTLSAGVSIDHIAAMSVPFFGGLLWTSMGYKYVFIAAAGIAVLNLILASRVKIDAVVKPETV